MLERVICEAPSLTMVCSVSVLSLMNILASVDSVGEGSSAGVDCGVWILCG